MKLVMRHNVILVALLTFRLLLQTSEGAEISAFEAKEYAEDWLRGRTEFKVSRNAGKTVSPNNVRTVRNTLRKPLFHVVKLEGGGFVVIAGDDSITPVVAFSDDADLIEDDRNPLWVLLNQDIPMRLAFLSRLENGQTATPIIMHSGSQEKPAARTGTASLDDMRVRPIIQSKWDQTTVGGKTVYNYHTPSGMPCGCVATAAAQVMRYHAFPTNEVSRESFLCEISGRDTMLSTIGGVYDWSLMPLVPGSDMSDSAREMIGRLVYDVGVASRMSYGYSGSGTIAYYTQQSLKSLFGYRQAVYAEQFNTKLGVVEQLQNALLANFDAGYPVMMGISGKDVATRQNIGHEIVGDGYGYIGDDLYVHLNLGWSGNWDAWYNLPNIDAYSGRNGYSFNLFDDMVYNIFPDDDYEIVSGRVVGADGESIAGARVIAFDDGGNAAATAVTSEFGIYAVKIPANETVTLVAELDGLSGGNKTVTAGKSQTHTTYFNETHASSLASSVGNRWGNDLAIEAGSCVAPNFSRQSCSFVDEIKVYCSQPDEKATIRYTDDGTEPDEASRVWPSEGLTLRTTTILKARTFRKGMVESHVTEVCFTDHPQPTISERTISWEKPVGASYYKVFKSANRFGAELEECTGWEAGNTCVVEAPESVQDSVFYFVSAASQPSDDYASPLSDAVACPFPPDEESGVATQECFYFGVDGGTNKTFAVADFPVTVQAVYYDTAGAFGENGFFKVNVPTTGKKNIPLPENSEGGVIKTTRTVSGARFEEADGTAAMSTNMSGREPRAWRALMYFEQRGETNYVGRTSIAASPVCFHHFQQCAPFVDLRDEEISVAGSSTNGVFHVVCPREYEWSAVSDSPWLILVRSRGRGSCPARFAVAPNPGNDARTATITVTCGNDRKTLTVEQGKHEDEPSVPVSIQVVATQGTRSSSVFLHWTGVAEAYEYEIYRSGVSEEMPFAPYWISSNSIPALIDFAVVPGEVYNYRIVAVTQEGRTPPSAVATGWASTFVSANIKNVVPDPTGGVVRVVISSNAGWSATTDSDWLRLDAIDTERNGVLDISVEPNEQGDERMAEIELIGGEGTANPSYGTIIVQQAPQATVDGLPKVVSGNEGGQSIAQEAGFEDSIDADPTARVVLEILDGVAHVTWESSLSEEEQGRRTYILWGRETLDGRSSWRKLSGLDDSALSAMRFFKISVKLK